MTTNTATNAVLATLYSAPLQPELWDVFLARLASLSSVNKAALLSHDFRSGEHKLLASLGDTVRDRANIDDYENRYWQLDKWTERGRKVARSGKILRGQELWPEEDLLKSEFYNDFLERVEVFEMAALVATKSEGVFHALSVYRGTHEAPFAGKQLAPLTMIAPHLQSALGMRSQFQGLDSSTPDLDTAFDQLPTAVVFVDDHGKPVLANQAARRICDTTNNLNLSANGLTAPDPTENSRLTEIISRAISAGAGKSTECGGTTFVSRTKKRPLQVFAAPFVSHEIPVPKGAVAVVFIADKGRQPQRAAARLH